VNIEVARKRREVQGKTMVEKGLSQEVSRSHSSDEVPVMGMERRTEQFVVFSLPKFSGR